jgi:hypothetical protein
MLDHDIIEVSNSNWSSPVLLVPKPDGTYRFCTDFRKVNSVTKTDSHPLPRIEDVIDRIGNSTFVTKIDLLSGYWQIPLTEKAKQISAFVTPDGLYQYRRMPFGLKNAPSSFQRMMNGITRKVENCDSYIDDVVVYSSSFSQHLSQLRKLFTELRLANLTINLSKSEFCLSYVTYLGHNVGNGKVRPVSAKVEAIDHMSPPTNVRQLRRFLGMSGFYRRFCPNFSSVAAPLTTLLKRNVKFVWDTPCQSAFEQIKAMLTSNPVLKAPEFGKPFKLAVDASEVGVGAVLLQEDTNGMDHPIAYFSQKLNAGQSNYSTIEKEALALVLALQHFEIYVTSSVGPLVVYTDHNPLTFMKKFGNKNPRLIRWALYFQNFDLCIKHIKGRNNIVADALSRIP